MEQHQAVCKHFLRKAKVVCPDCNETFACHLCHDEKWEFAKKKAHIMHWKEVEQIVCGKCQTKQPISNKCIRSKCSQKFGNYFCGKCRVWTFNPQPIFHCDDCNTCHQADKETVQHCTNCKMCINKTEFAEHQHQCFPEKLDEDCCICQEPLRRGTSHIKRIPCGHLLHVNCWYAYSVQKSNEIAEQTINTICIGCPLCKKSMIPLSDITSLETIKRLDAFNESVILNGTKVNIYCYECEKFFTEQPNYMYNKCPDCKFYNTYIVNYKKMIK